MFALTRQDTSVMKGIAICAMLFHHLYGFPPDGVEPYTGVLAWFGILGKICVALFLFCSGYGLAANYKPQSLLDDVKFIAKRLVKFYANYWVIFLIFVPITIFACHRSLADAYGAGSNVMVCLLKDIMGIQGFDSYNITWWFNLLIIILYLIFPLLYRAAQHAPWMVLLIGLVVMRMAYHLPYSSIDVFTYQFPFVVGVVWQLYENKFTKVTTWLTEHKYIFAICSVALAVLFIVLRMWPIIPSWSGSRIEAFLSCSIVLMVISIGRYMPHTSNAFAFLGKHSINIYMMHTFFNAFYCKELLHTGEWLRGGGNFVLLMIICLLISMVIEFLKEKIRLYELVNIISKRI
jgi:peptidoglycan/LPS O-acetylase OafA/YrhL